MEITVYGTSALTIHRKMQPETKEKFNSDLMEVPDEIYGHFSLFRYKEAIALW